MNEQEIKKLLDQQDVPAPRDEAKQQAKLAAMQAFEETQSEKKRQGFSHRLRLMGDIHLIRKIEMVLTQHRLAIGGAATACLVLLGVFSIQQSPDLMDKGLPYPGNGKETVSSDVSSSPNSKVNAEAVADDTAPLQEEIVVSGLRAESAAEAEFAQSSALQSAPAKRELSAKVERRQLSAVASAPASSLVAADSYGPAKVEENRDRFEAAEENRVMRVTDEPVSTFSIDVDTASYSYVRRQLNRGVLPQKDAVRTEEMVNYFDYKYPLPETKGVPFEPTVAVHNAPWNANNKLIHIGIKGYELADAAQPDSNLVFLLDVSGSMNSDDKLPLVKQSFSLLLDTLKPTDTVAIVVYAGAAGTVLEPTEVSEKGKIMKALDQLQAGGSTAGAQGIERAYELAERNYKEDAVNRVILATDGDFNVGVTQDERLQDYVERKRDQGVYLSVLGFGRGNYQDALMQTLAQNGNGVAAYIDTLSEAQKVLVNEATSSLFPIANDVKIQVEFNPETVKEYRLIGYETRALNQEDFNNDKVDAGDIGAGHSVTAIYEITSAQAEGLMPELRYGKQQPPSSQSANEYGFLKMRYKLPGDKASKLLTTPIAAEDTKLAPGLKQEVDFATAVAGFSQLLKGSDFIGDYDFDDVIALAQANKGEDEFGYRTEFVQLVRKAKIAKEM